MTAKPLVLQALDALNALDRRAAVALLRQDMANGPSAGQRWQSVAQLAGTIGETRLELEAMRRFAQTQPQTLNALLALCTLLARRARSDEALALLDSLPQPVQDLPSVLHFRGMAASEKGDFAHAESLFRKALAKSPLTVQSWFGLALIRKFAAGDADLSMMEGLNGDLPTDLPPDLRTQWVYTLAKVYDDVNDKAKAAALYQQGARIMRAAAPFDMTAQARLVESVIRDFTPEALAQLTPSQCDSQRAIFVNGLPRSGTTLVEQIISSHSDVKGGGELNLIRPALIPVGEGRFNEAMAYQQRVATADPWGELGRDYLDMLEQRLGADLRVVDKSLDQSALVGLILHMLPQARMVWIRRNPDDCALSNFRTHFKDSLNWTWSFSDIAAFFRLEDRLHAHWTQLFPQRILTVAYEDLVSDPLSWTQRILSHVGLSEEPQVFAPHLQKRSVMTASVAQVRNPISTDRIGLSGGYEAMMAEFRAAYYNA
ncbi:MAG: sulfotransferase [Asticcacaulis sp.]|uniref:sulfotransferase family protein n=1 Tax=Asticcacaulis sp. TaxID=1872648 RepID=UPI003F7BB33A